MVTKAQQSWLITINNPTETERDLLTLLDVSGRETHDDIKYVKYALEQGDDETPHIQAYLYLHKPQRFSWVQKRLKRAAIFPTVGTPQQCTDYIGNPTYTYSESHPDPRKRGKRKGGTSDPPVVWGNLDGIKMDKGTRPPRKKKDDLLLEIKEKIDTGAKETDLWEEYFPIMVVYSERILKYYALKGLDSERDEIAKKYEELRRERREVMELQHKEIREILNINQEIQ